MEEEKLSKGLNTLWTFFGFSHVYRHFLGKFSIGNGKNLFRNLGFTLIELVIVVLVLGILLVISILLMNPSSQIQKVKDTKRQNDLTQLYTALDTYYSDKGCYPTALSQLNSGTPIYIKTLPTDPDTSSGVAYNYIIDSFSNNACPQWFSIVTRGYKVPNSSPCALEQLNSCLPINYTSSGYNFCKISGKVDCAVVSSYILLPLYVTPIPTATPTPLPLTPTSTSTPSPTPVICYPKYFAVSVGRCNVLDTDPKSQCTIHGGSLTCWSAGGEFECSGLKCDQ